MGWTTFKRQEMGYGIEPDECFYLENHQVMVGKERIDLSIDPPPDLAIGMGDRGSRTKYRHWEKPSFTSLSQDNSRPHMKSG
ncbi:hypothetical protein [Lusitaniella coriacea]|uniref:hypothetical protein n=1 Tax=Lusitaniella coriacea TaxID=1983105 RepID=UPI001E440BD2|nr:hypothetical protein [Lusitaniella coriacea]